MRLELLDHFGAMKKALLKTWRRSLFLGEASIDTTQEVSIDTTSIRESNDDLRKLQVLPYSSRNFTTSLWPHIRLFTRVFKSFVTYAFLHTWYASYYSRRESLGLEREIWTPWEREDLELSLFLYLFFISVFRLSLCFLWLCLGSSIVGFKVLQGSLMVC